MLMKQNVNNDGQQIFASLLLFRRINLKVFKISVLPLFRHKLDQIHSDSLYILHFLYNYKLYQTYCTSKKRKTFIVVDTVNVMNVRSVQSC